MYEKPISFGLPTAQLSFIYGECLVNFLGALRQ